MNEHGFSFVETLLAVVILFFLASTLIPMTVLMKQQIVSQKIQTHAAEVAFNGALSYSRYGQATGTQQIDDVLFTWSHNGAGICVTYNTAQEELELCV